MNLLGFIFLTGELVVVLGVAAAIVIRKVWPPIDCPFCYGEGCPRCGETGEINPRELDQAAEVEVDGGRPVNELDYALRIGGDR